MDAQGLSIGVSVSSPVSRNEVCYSSDEDDGELLLYCRSSPESVRKLISECSAITDSYCEGSVEVSTSMQYDFDFCRLDPNETIESFGISSCETLPQSSNRSSQRKCAARLPAHEIVRRRKGLSGVLFSPHSPL